MLLQSLIKKYRGTLSNYRAQVAIKPSLDSLACGGMIAQAVREKRPYLVGRLGWMEGYAIGKLLSEGETPLVLREKLMQHTGLFPATSEELTIFSDLHLEALRDADLLGLIEAPYHGWVIKKYAKRATVVALDLLEPYFLEQPWSWELRGMRVLVVHPFATSIVKQYTTVREHIFKNPKTLPHFELKVIQAPQTITGNSRAFSSWSATLEELLRRVQQEHFDVALIGCGGYGLPLAAAVKKMGRVAIHLGGATQLLFGISGWRWAEHPAFLKYRSIMTEAWQRPLETERPMGWDKIENGCYW
jgi:hypothetical protein